MSLAPDSLDLLKLIVTLDSHPTGGLLLILLVIAVGFSIALYRRTTKGTGRSAKN